MRVPVNGRIRSASLVVVVLVLAAGGIAYTSIPDSTTGVIHGCYKTNKGDLRVIDPGTGGACTGTETSLDWPAGPSDAYTTLGSASVPGDAITAVPVASLSLPVGRFVLSATATAANPGDETDITTIVTCFFNAPGAAGGVSNSGVSFLQPHFHATIPILGNLTVRSGPATVDLLCRASGNHVSIGSILIATQVGTIR